MCRERRAPGPRADHRDAHGSDAPWSCASSAGAGPGGRLVPEPGKPREASLGRSVGKPWSDSTLGMPGMLTSGRGTAAEPVGSCGRRRPGAGPGDGGDARTTTGGVGRPRSRASRARRREAWARRGPGERSATSRSASSLVAFDRYRWWSGVLRRLRGEGRGIAGGVGLLERRTSRSPQATSIATAPRRAGSAARRGPRSAPCSDAAAPPVGAGGTADPEWTGMAPCDVIAGARPGTPVIAAPSGAASAVPAAGGARCVCGGRRPRGRCPGRARGA